MAENTQPIYDIPKELTYSSLLHFAPSKKTEVRQTPLNGTGPLSPGTVVSILIGEKQRSFMNPATLALKFLVTYNVGASAGTVKSYILGGGYGHFKDLTITGVQGNYTEVIQNHNLLTNLIYSTTLNSADKCAMINLGYDDTAGLNNSNAGISIPSAAAASTVYRSFTLPILSSLNCDKMIPLACGDIRLDFTINFLPNFIVSANNAATPVTNFTISEIELVYDTIELYDPAYTQLIKGYNNVINIKSNYYQHGATQALPVGTGGGIDLPMTHKYKSMKQLLWSCIPTDAWEKDFSGVNPNLTSWYLAANTENFPQKPIPVRFVSEAYYQNSKAFGSVYSSLHSGNCRRDTFAKACILAADPNNLAVREYSPYTIAPANNDAVTSISNTASNKFYQVLDIEKINQVATNTFSGANTIGGQNTIHLEIGKQLEGAAGVTFKVYYWSINDCVLTFDLENRQITVDK